MSDDLAALEQQRAFLLSSLEDLDREYAAGDVDVEDYRALRDGYTHRTAAVLRAIESGRAQTVESSRRQWVRAAVTTAVVVVIAVGAGIFVAASSGQRMPGQELTGAIPGDISATLARARSVLGVDPVLAQSLYTEVLAERPEHPEALAYSGWLLALNSIGASEEIRDLALDTAMESLRRAAIADPNYADPRCFAAIIAARLLGDADLAAVEVEACLANDPPAELRGLIEELVTPAR